MSIPGPVSPDVLSVRGLSKAFGAVQALRDVSVDCRAGEIHALVGENGSGKSTLLGIASGFLAPDEGTVEIDGRRLAHHSPAAARRLGLGIAYQDYSHVLDLSVAENVYLAVPADERPPYGQMESWVEKTLATFNIDFAVSAATGSLSLAERQMLEVAKALLTRPKVLLLDEPTTALGPEAVEQFHALVLEQAQAGVGIVYVSHRLPEVLAVAHRVTVLRDGVAQGTFEAAAVSEEELVALMIGRPLQGRVPRTAGAPGAGRGRARGVGAARRALRPHRPRGAPGRDPRNRGRGGQRPGAVPAGARRRRAGGPAAHRATARRSTRARRSDRCVPESSCSAATGAARRCSRSSASAPTRPSRCSARSRVRASSLRSRERACDRRSRAASPRADGIDGAARAVALGRQPAEGLAHAAVPPRRRQGDPRRGADAGRRRRRALRHLRGAACEGRRGSRRRRQVERSDSSSPGSATASSSCRAARSSRRSPATS